MGKNLVIVESPAKAKTIEKFLGKDYKVKSSYGHVRDLAKKNFGIDVENNFKPEYIVMPDKKKIVAELKKEVKAANTVLLASDEDREGEAIAWHLYEVLNLKKKETKRIVFNEITKTAIQNAVDNPGNINIDLVNAQQARRVLDRLVGFKLSAVLWKKVQGKLSAGRVQSVAVKLLVEREREIINFKPQSSFKVVAEFTVEENGAKRKFSADLSEKLKTEKDVVLFLEGLNSPIFKVSNIEKKPGKRSPSAPFTTSSLQQEAGRKLGFPVGKTMRVAQKLYEAGQITYMRTDSVNLSSLAINTAKKVIVDEFGEKFYKKRVFKTKSKSAQEAHEAIRPTYLQNKTVNGSYDEVRLYDLIRKRTLASQMSDAIFEKTNIEIDFNHNKYKFQASGEVLVFPGFIQIYTNELDAKNNVELLPKVEKGQILDLEKIDAQQQFSKYPPRYTEAALVKQLEDKGIGRPSTYAPTISTIQKRAYVIKENRDGLEKKYTNIRYKNGKIEKKTELKQYGAEKNKLFPTDIAMVVTDFLSDNFDNIIDYNFTANVEKEFDNIAEGGVVWYKMIENFYKNFNKKVEKTIEEVERNTGERILGEHPKNGKQISVRIGRYGPVVQLGKQEDEEKPQFASLTKEQHIETITLDEALELLENAGNGRLLGTDPNTGKKIYARFARYGAVVQLGEATDKEDKPKYAGLLKGMTLDNITLEQAVELFKLPRDVGEYEGKKVVAAVGRFGPYIRHDSKFVSLKKTDDPLSVTIERAIELIEEKREADRKRLIKEFKENEEVKVIKDRWGKPCIFYKKKYLRLNPKIKPEEITLDECLKIIEKEMPKPKAKAKKKTTKKVAKKTPTAKKKK